MPKFALSTYSMNRLDFLQQAIESFLSVPDIEVVVCDYSCPQGTGDWVEANHPTVKVVRVPGQKRFNQPAARNAAIAACTAEWVCSIDSDMILNDTFATTILPQLRDGRFFRFFPLAPGFAGTSIFRRADWEQLGGYDEALTNFGDDDLDFYDGLKYLGREQVSLPTTVAKHIDHDVGKRLENYDLKNLRSSILTGRVYRVIKWEWVRFVGHVPPLDARRWLYQKMVLRVPVVLRKVDPMRGAYKTPQAHRQAVVNALLQLVVEELGALGVPFANEQQLARCRTSIST